MSHYWWTIGPRGHMEPSSTIDSGWFIKGRHFITCIYCQKVASLNSKMISINSVNVHRIFDEYKNLPHLWQISLFSLAKTAHVNALRFFNTGRWIFHTRLWVRATKTLYLNRLEVSNPRWRTMNSLLWIFLEDFRSVQASRQLTEF